MGSEMCIRDSQGDKREVGPLRVEIAEREGQAERLQSDNGYYSRSSGVARGNPLPSPSFPLPETAIVQPPAILSLLTGPCFSLLTS